MTPDGPVVRVLRGALVAVAALAVAAIIILPIADLALARIFWKGIAPAGAISDHATLVRGGAEIPEPGAVPNLAGLGALRVLAFHACPRLLRDAA